MLRDYDLSDLMRGAAYGGGDEPKMHWSPPPPPIEVRSPFRWLYWPSRLVLEEPHRITITGV